MTDLKSLPDNHALRPLELRMLEMLADMPSPLMVAGGNFVAALRVFAARHPGLVDRTCTCRCCGAKYGGEEPTYLRSGEFLNPWLYCPECRRRESTGAPCPACTKDAA